MCNSAIGLHREAKTSLQATRLARADQVRAVRQRKRAAQSFCNSDGKMWGASQMTAVDFAGCTPRRHGIRLTHEVSEEFTAHLSSSSRPSSNDVSEVLQMQAAGDIHLATTTLCGLCLSSRMTVRE